MKVRKCTVWLKMDRVAANTNWVGNAEGVANAIGYANAAVATLAGVAVVVLAVVGAVFTVK